MNILPRGLTPPGRNGHSATEENVNDPGISRSPICWYLTIPLRFHYLTLYQIDRTHGQRCPQRGGGVIAKPSYQIALCECFIIPLRYGGHSQLQSSFYVPTFLWVSEFCVCINCNCVKSCPHLCSVSEV